MNRRNFLKNTFVASAASPLFLNGISVNPLKASLFSTLMCDGIKDRALVIVQLKGGNDGLNTLIPINQYDEYAALRPNIKVPDTGINPYINVDMGLALEDQLGLHPQLAPFKALYDEGKFSIVRGVSYPENNKSHFAATDIWFKGADGSNANAVNSGWMGRYLQYAYPNVAGNPSSQMPDPIAMQLGDPKPALGFHTEHEHAVEINLTGQDPAGYYTLVQSIGGAPIANVPASEYGDELLHIMGVEESVNVYSQRISDVFAAGNNSSVTYPDFDLADQLKTVARLIQGGSKTKVFLVTLGGFDTHAFQVDNNDPTNAMIGRHAVLMEELAKSIQAFQDDLEALSLDERVLTVTFSEFGRKASENGNFGTDHGSLAPMFVIGTGVEPGVRGTNPDLINLGDNDQLLGLQHDYRQVFTTLLQDWLGASQNALDATLFGNFGAQKLNLVNTSSIVDSSCYFDHVVDPLPEVNVSITVFFQGAYDPDSMLMRDDLRMQNLLPTSEPYTGLDFVHIGGGGEFASSSVFDVTGAAAIVDWVFIELRDKDDPEQIVATRSAFIQRNGLVVDVDGISAVKFLNVTPDSYYVSVKHRNHLGVMTEEPQVFN